MDVIKMPSYVKAVYIALLIIIIIFFMIVAKKILVPLFISGYIAMLLTSACNRLERRKIPRALSATICLALFVIIISGTLIFIYFQVRSFIEDLGGDALSQKVNSYAIDLNRWAYENLGIDMGMYNGFEFSKAVAIVQTEDATPSQLLFSMLSTVSDILLLPVFIFFLLIYRDHLAVFISKVFSKEKNTDLLIKLTSIRRIVYAYMSGAGKVMLILAVLNTAVLFALGIEHAIFFGVLAGMLNIIPYLGPILGAILPFIFALITKDTLFYPIAVIVSFSFVQILENAYLTPKITGSNVNLNALVTFIGLLIGAAIWGIIGMVLIIPTIAILKKLFEMSPDTEPYAYLFGEEDSNWFKRRPRKRKKVVTEATTVSTDTKKKL